MVITEISIIHHVGIVLLLLWFLNSYDSCYPIVYFASLIYLYLVHERYSMRMGRKLQFEERKAANQRRILTDSETVRWLNHAVEKMWPICIEHIISQRIFLPIIPWFLAKYKPWTVKEAAVQNLYLGRSPPLFTDIRVLHESSGDDHLALELGLNFLTADDMTATLTAKLRRRLGFGIVAKMHLTSMHVEGKEREQTGEEVKKHGEKPDLLQREMARPKPFSSTKLNRSQKVADTFEAIDVEGQKETGIWVHHPGSETSQAWESRKGKSRHVNSEIVSVDSPKSSLNSSDDESKEGRRAKVGSMLHRGFQKMFHRHPDKEDYLNSFGQGFPSTNANIKPVRVKRAEINLVIGDVSAEPVLPTSTKLEGFSSNEGSGAENSGKYDMKGRAKGMLRNVGKSARRLKQKLSRKGSSKFLENSEEKVLFEADTSDAEDSLSSSHCDQPVGGIPIVSNFMSTASNDEAEPDEPVDEVLINTRSETSTTDSGMGRLDAQNIVTAGGSEVNATVPIESNLKPDSSEGKVDGGSPVEA